jgi:membrane fusion protein (multidrug efflux system)
MSDQDDSKPVDRADPDGKMGHGEEAASHGGKQEGGQAVDEQKEKKPSIFSKPLFWIILIVVIAVIVVGGTLYYLNARQYESTDDAFVDAHIVRIAPTVSGTLTYVANSDNRHVAPGTLLAVIDASTSTSQVAEAESNVKQAQAQLEQAQAQVAAAQAQRDQAAAQARVPLANAVKAAQDLARYESLLKLDSTAVAGQQLDQARANARSTAAEAAAARRQIDSANAQVTVARKQIGASQAAIAARRAQVQQANVTLGDARLTAPVAGQIVNRQVNLGSYVGPGTQLMALVPDEVWITANFKETQLQRMRIGQPVTIKIDAYPDVEFKGHVDSVQRGAGQAFALLPPQNATGNYVKVVQRVPVRILFDHDKDSPDPRKYPLGPGMSAVPTVKVR